MIDSQEMEIRISKERLNDTLCELNSWLKLRHVTKRKLLSLIGKLSFICKVVRSGRTFVRRLIERSKHVKHLQHKVKVNKMIKDDINWWLTFLPQWNGVSVIGDLNWTPNVSLDLYSDASDLAIGGLCNNSWFIVPFVGQLSNLRKKNIAWRELYGVVKSIATFSDVLTGKRLTIHCDNLAIVSILQSGSSKDQDIMDLMRTLFYIGAKYHFECRAVHVPGVVNKAADALSRLNLNTFFLVMPTAEPFMTKPVDIICNDIIL